jgi:hypothetical protein
MKLVACLFVVSALLLAQAVRMTTVEPDSGKAGATMTAVGEGLTKPNVEKVYLTDGKLDIEVKIVEQGDKAIKFEVPASAKPGRFSLMILTGGNAPKYIEQPVKLTIVE